LFSNPDHVCKPNCNAQVTNINYQIQQILNLVASMKNGPNMFGSSLTAMDVLSKIADNLTGAKTNITNAQDSPNRLASNAGTLNMTIDMMIGTLESARTLHTPEKRTNLDSSIESLKALQPLLATLVQCFGGTFTKL